MRFAFRLPFSGKSIRGIFLRGGVGKLAARPTVTQEGRL